jgi:hypothetical protein
MIEDALSEEEIERYLSVIDRMIEADPKFAPTSFTRASTSSNSIRSSPN